MFGNMDESNLSLIADLSPPSMPRYYALVGTVCFAAGVFVDQNYNVPDIKYYLKHTKEVVRCQ